MFISLVYVWCVTTLCKVEMKKTFCNFKTEEQLNFEHWTLFSKTDINNDPIFLSVNGHENSSPYGAVIGAYKFC